MHNTEIETETVELQQEVIYCQFHLANIGRRIPVIELMCQNTSYKLIFTLWGSPIWYIILL